MIYSKMISEISSDPVGGWSLCCYFVVVLCVFMVVLCLLLIVFWLFVVIESCVEWLYNESVCLSWRFPIDSDVQFDKLSVTDESSWDLLPVFL